MEVNAIISALSRLALHPPGEATIEQCINHWLKSAKRVLTLANSDPSLFIALIHLDSPLSQNTRHVMLLTLFGKLNQYNDHYLQHTIAASLATQWVGKQQDASRISAFFKFLRVRKLLLWQDILSLYKSITRSSALPRLLSQPRLTDAQCLCVIAKLCASKPKGAEAGAIFSLIVRNISPNHKHLVLNLIRLFTGAVPGAKVFVSGKPGVVLDIQKDHAFVISLHEDDIDGSWQPLNRTLFPKPLYIPFEHLVALYSQTAETRKSRGGNAIIPVAFAIQSPPSALLSIIDELQKRDCEIPTLCSKIEAVPTFNRFLLNTASQDNRLQLQVKNIKQAVMTYGIERVGDMLIQFALMERLTQKQFPLMPMCKQFTMLSCAIAAELASLSNTKFSPQSAALTMTFLCAPLFTLPGLKIMKALPINHQLPFSLEQTLKVKSNTSWLTLSGELSGNWHQSATWRAVIHHCGKQNNEVPSSLRKEQAIMLLAFAVSKTSLFGGDVYSLRQDVTYKTLVRLLSLTEQDINGIITSQSSLFFCPLTH
jgi:hypothetical protein